MLDQLSEILPPSKTYSSKSIYDNIIASKKYLGKLEDTYILSECVKFMNEYPQENMGSFIGWQVFGIKECTNEILKLLDNHLSISK